MRMRGDDIADIAYRKWLMDVGNGTLTSHEDHTMAIPSDMVLSNQSMDGLISYVYSDMNRHLGNARYFRDRAILAPRNYDVDIVNAKTLCAMSGDNVEYFSADSISEDSMQQSFLYSVEFLNGLNLGGGFPVHYLQLKLNAPIILLRNLDPSHGLCNGTRLVCKASKSFRGKNSYRNMCWDKGVYTKDMFHILRYTIAFCALTAAISSEIGFWNDN
ncbi:hypothetical protein L7F22_055072 [Adiantum nelumboides]|nr:hypothetical protein [Adiantum nelumboides]